MDSRKELEIKEQEFFARIDTIKDEKEGRRPIKDGIINIEKYLRAEYKILWILREPVDEWIKNKKGEWVNGGWNLVREIYDPLTEDGIKKLLVARRIMETTYKILAKSENALEAFKSIAYINIKKIPGHSSGHIPAEMKQAYNDHNALLKDQINTYAPHIVICGNVLPYFSEDHYFDNNPQNKKHLYSFTDGSRYCYFPLKDRLYINTYHPSYTPKKYRMNKEAKTEFWNKCTDGIIDAVSVWKKNKGKENG